MQTVPVTDAKSRLSDLVESVSSTSEVVTITRHGYPAAVLMSAAEFEAITETLAWMAEPGIDEDLAAARADVAARRTVSLDEVRRRLTRTTR